MLLIKALQLVKSLARSLRLIKYSNSVCNCNRVYVWNPVQINQTFDSCHKSVPGIERYNGVVITVQVLYLTVDRGDIARVPAHASPPSTPHNTAINLFVLFIT